MKDLQQILEGIGLSENESKIYLAILELGKSGVTHISKKSGIKRTTIYSYIDPLLEKNYIKRTIYKKRTLFTAEKPQNLLKIFEKRKEDFMKKLPLLEGIYNKNYTHSHLELYEDVNSIKKLYNEIWSSGLTVLTFFSPRDFYKKFSEEFDKSLGDLEIQAGGKTKTILRHNDYSKKYKTKNAYSSYKLLPKDFEIEVDLIILGTTIVMISFEPMYAIKLKNKPLADFLRNLHDYFWKIL